MKRSAPLPKPIARCCLGAAVLIVPATLGCQEITLDFETEGTLEPAPTSPPDPPPAPQLIVETDFDLSVENLRDRECSDGGEGVSYMVESSRGPTLTLTSEVTSGCLEPGDEVLLIELQGAESSTRVGRHELLRLNRIDGSEVEFVSPPTQEYGNGDENDWNAKESVVVLQRVPRFSRVVVREGATLRAGKWTNGGSGVLALRAIGDISIEGTVSMTGAGFAGGARRPVALAHGIQGESIFGSGHESREANSGGGGGGLGDQTTSGCVQDGNAGGGGAHRDDGEDAIVLDFCDAEGRGRGGLAYAEPGLLFLGSGGGSGGMDNITVDNPPGASGGNGGGIVWLMGQSILGDGSVESRGNDGVGDEVDVECSRGGSTTSCFDHSGPGGGGAGGSIRLDATRIDGIQLDVGGGKGGNGYDTGPGNGGNGASGVIESSGF